METNKISRRIFSLFGILAISAMLFSCETGKMASNTESESISENVTSGTQTAKAMDSMIKDLNQDFSSVEREVMTSDKVTDDEFREDWRALEVKRHELNRKIEQYNQAVERDASIEASELRTDISGMINEIESDLQSFRQEYGTGSETETGTGVESEPQQPEFQQQEDPQQDMQWPE